MTKGQSSRNTTTPYGNLVLGNKDKLMISYKREPSHDYSMNGACGVMFEGEMHFFGGFSEDPGYNITHQHFVIETQRGGQTVEMIRNEYLKFGMIDPSCSNFEMTSEYFPWFKTNVVILCFGYGRERSCYSFDGKLNHIGDSNFGHWYGGLTKYKQTLLTAGGRASALNDFQKTEILKLDRNRNFTWSVVEPEFKFTPGKWISGHSLINVESSDVSEEYVLLIGGQNCHFQALDNVFKFNGTWSSFGKLNSRRWLHNSIYWNGAIYVIGGKYDSGHGHSYMNTKMEIWNIKDSPDQFQTIETWPELIDWQYPHLFIVPDSFFPDVVK